MTVGWSAHDNDDDDGDGGCVERQENGAEPPSARFISVLVVNLEETAGDGEKASSYGGQNTKKQEVRTIKESIRQAERKVLCEEQEQTSKGSGTWSNQYDRN